jgi:hypothetical protein
MFMEMVVLPSLEPSHFCIGDFVLDMTLSLYWCLTTDSLPQEYLGQLFRLRRVLELDSERSDSRFILVRALDRDRVITLRPVGVSFTLD